MTSVSIHAPARGATHIKNKEDVQITFQSTHPHGVRLEIFGAYVGLCKVSIHAPARGATNYYATSLKALGVSIHAPARGATTCPNLF